MNVCRDWGDLAGSQDSRDILVQQDCLVQLESLDDLDKVCDQMAVTVQVLHDGE